MRSVMAVNIVMSNDDGWAEYYLRSLYKRLTNAGHNVVLSAPALDNSGTGSLDFQPTVLDSDCVFESCQAGDDAYGHFGDDSRLNYVNS